MELYIGFHFIAFWIKIKKVLTEEQFCYMMKLKLTKLKREGGEKR
jgi:hypothetical protein